MKTHLVQIERRALRALNSGRFEEAARLFEAIVREVPGWEHGTAMYSLACCYEELGNIALAERSYRGALQYEPLNPIFVGGLASFLYLYGDLADSFSNYLTLLRLQLSAGDHRSAGATELAVKALGERMGLSDTSVAEKIAAVSING